MLDFFLGLSLIVLLVYIRVAVLLFRLFVLCWFWV